MHSGDSPSTPRTSSARPSPRPRRCSTWHWPSPTNDAVIVLARKLRGLDSRSVRIVDALLDLATVEDIEFTTGAIALREIVAHALGDVEAEASARQIRVGAHVPDGHVLGEPTLLAQLLRNLVENAVRHNHHGGAVTVGGTVTAAGTMILSIQNTGPVITPEALQLLTEPFYRAQGRSRRSGDRPGHGLGLALAQAIAAAHGTRLVLTAPGTGGLIATIDLPLQA